MKRVQKLDSAPEEKLEDNVLTGSNIESEQDKSLSEEQSEEYPVDSKTESEEGNIANTPESTIINDGTEGNAGQDYLNSIEVDADVVEKAKDFEEENTFTSLHIKFQNALTDLERIRDARLSPEKDEDLEVAIVYVGQAAIALEKLRQ